MASYSDALKYLEQLEVFGMKLGLENITELCRKLGNPQSAYKTIHVTGTNGKGSVTAMCASILEQAGYKSGMYTSPHLQTIRERIQVNGRKITQKEFLDYFLKVKGKSGELKEKGMRATHFEFVTAMALLFFKEQACDFAILEVGLGGRLDATNVVKPLVAVITNIELDHTQHLGDTKEKIALEKAGIIKRNCITVTGEKSEVIKQIFRKVCKERGSRLIEVKKDYSGKILLLGKHQRANAAVAVAAIKSLGKYGIKITDKAIRRGIETTKWPGRLEIVQQRPTVILDGAHNPSKAKTAADYLKKLGKKTILVVGISFDKDIPNTMMTLASFAKKIIITRAKYRGTDCSILKREAVKYRKEEEVEIIEDVREAVKKAIREAKDEIVMVTGSLFVVGEARDLWYKEKS